MLKTPKKALIPERRPKARNSNPARAQNSQFSQDTFPHLSDGCRINVFRSRGFYSSESGGCVGTGVAIVATHENRD
jgi:hypothetical protein